MSPGDGQEILNDKKLQGTAHTWEALITHYGGNPLALKLVAQVIREVFGGEITAFLKDGEVFFHDIRDVLEQQVARLSAREVEIVYWLAIEREAIGLNDLQEDIATLSQRRAAGGATVLTTATADRNERDRLHPAPVIMEYLTARLVDRVCEEIKTGTLVLFEQCALLLAQAKECIWESQCRLILRPLLQRLLAIFRKKALEQRFQSLLATLREQGNQRPGYAAGNLLNLLIQMGCTLRGYDFSHLVVRQAYLQGVGLPEVDFAHANLATSVFTDIFGSTLCVAFSQREACWRQERQPVRSDSGMLQRVSHCKPFGDTPIGSGQWPSAPMAGRLPAAVMTRRCAVGGEQRSVPQDSARPYQWSGRWPSAPMGGCLPAAVMTRRYACGR